MRKTLKEALRPLYEAMLKDEKISVLSGQNYCCMAPCVGNQFPEAPNDGIVIYGRANNGWNTGVDDNYDVIYDKGSEGLTDYIKGNSSPFFRTAGKAFSNFYGEDWYEYVTYSNLYKVAPPVGNPGQSVCDSQWKYITDIFSKEIEVLSPRFVVLFTNENWGMDFLLHLNKEVNSQVLSTREWAGYHINVYKIGDVYFLLTEHPQGKPEWEHADAIINIIQDVKEGKL